MKLFKTLILFFVSQTTLAQFHETIRTSRPGQAIEPFTVGKDILQFQQGLDYYSLADTKYPPHSFISNNVIRYGIIENIELSTLIDYQFEQTKFDTNSTYLSGLSNLHFGFRIHINDQKGWIPTTGFQVRLKVPKISNEFGSNQLATVMVLIANWNLPKNMSLGTNWILSYNGIDFYPTSKYILNFGFLIYKKWSGFIENYGQFRKNVFQTRFDGGFAYLINNNILLDISIGYGNNQNIQDYFISTGISWRIINFKKTIKK
ncbi:MAG: transporter [Vicingaceae bacterium]|jgi:outer membrane putative beta-barrel porin/alpha-amylase|nr:transporter [Vicingaceae bacterium]